MALFKRLHAGPFLDLKLLHRRLLSLYCHLLFQGTVGRLLSDQFSEQVSQGTRETDHRLVAGTCSAS
jgi:hypothetical protein